MCKEGAAGAQRNMLALFPGQRELVFGQKGGSVVSVRLAWKRKETTDVVCTVLYRFVEAIPV